MSKKSRAEQIALVLGRRTLTATHSTTPSTPGPAQGMQQSSTPCRSRETSQCMASAPNFSSLVRATWPATQDSDEEDSAQHPTAIIGTPATEAAYVDRLAGILGLTDSNRANLYSFLKVYLAAKLLVFHCPVIQQLAPTEQTLILQGTLLAMYGHYSSAHQLICRRDQERYKRNQESSCCTMETWWHNNCKLSPSNPCGKAIDLWAYSVLSVSMCVGLHSKIFLGMESTSRDRS